VTLIQAGYGLFGAAILTSFAQSGLWIPALAITAVITGLITAVVALVVFKTDHSFANWQKYSWGFFIGGFALGAAGYFISPMLMLVAGVLFFLGFVVDLTYGSGPSRPTSTPATCATPSASTSPSWACSSTSCSFVLRVLSILDN